MVKVGFIGSGKMAEALIRSMLNMEIMQVLVIASDISEERRNLIGNLDNVEATDDNLKVVEDAEVIFIAVKPQNIDEVLDEVKDTDKLVVSIAAGVPIRRLESKLTKARVIRIMPNTPCLVGEMAGGFALGTRATEADAEMLMKLLKNAGTIFQMDEEHLDTVTALSGSGPAFIAYIVKAMAEGAVKQGLPKVIAEQLAVQTALGTGKLLRDKEMSPEELITMVSSPDGTTVAGRKILESSDVKEILKKTIAAATERGRELGKRQN
ncbi:MAG: pyrroline-5-carboxylate reductase [Candidatus Bathyarchaeota archaeon]|nr:pyrroline-5-carboxylate reductase [Candidatus Bathyarchaeota archaeon]